MKYLNKLSKNFQIYRCIGSSVIIIIISILSLRYTTSPYIWIGLTLFSLLLYFSIISYGTVLKIILANISAVILAFTAFEAYITLKTSAKVHEVNIERQYVNVETDSNDNKSLVDEGNKHKSEHHKPLLEPNNLLSEESDSYDKEPPAAERKAYKNEHHKPFLEPNDLLGYAPVKNNKVLESKYFKEELVYSVSYTIDEDGLRISSEPGSLQTSESCVLFFGCSYTFGTGLNDNESMPFQVGIKSKGKYKIYNFGFTGYGPHQMLSAIEHELVENVVTSNKPVFAIYSAHVVHVARSAGLESWDVHGPRYILSKYGEVKYAGHFDDKRESTISKVLNKSNTLNVLSPLNQKNIDLLVAIISASKSKLTKLYPGIKFYVLLWDDRGAEIYNEETIKIMDDLRSKEITTLLISEILPDYKGNTDKYVISVNDTHPNALINEIIAEYIANNVLE